MNAERTVALVPYGSDPLETLASLLLDGHAHELPDLSRHVALFPSPGVIPHFRRCLLARAVARGHGALLGPWCGTLDMWIQQSAGGEALLLDQSERELLLLEALDSYPQLKERFGAWALADSLLALFDELNRHRRLPSMDAEQFTTLLAAGYAASPALAPLRGEAELVHTLWNSWNAHLAERGLSDKTMHRLSALADAQRARTGGSHHIYVIGSVDFTPPEAQWLKPLLSKGHATLILQGGTAVAEGQHPDVALHRCLTLLDLPATPVNISGDFAAFIDQVFLLEPDMARRAHRFVRTHDRSPLENRLHVHAAADFEREARAIDLAVRRWRASGKQRIGIVTNDRKLARRVRALLERANLALRDPGGWALSTTSAATVVMRWIECVEQDFAHRPLLDFLKSPFVTLGMDREQIVPLVHHFERHIVRGYNIGRDLDRYRRAALQRPLDSDSPAPSLLFDRLATALAPLATLTHGGKYPLERYLRALYQSLEATGLVATLGGDAAGAQLLEVLRPHRRTLPSRGPHFAWAEFRQWLERELERSRFHPSATGDGIELLDLADSRCRRFDALVLAGCTDEHLPGAPAASPFFNDGVRKQLGLPTRADQLLGPLHDFRRLLEAAPQVLITWRRSDRDEPLLASPWVERLTAFHRLAYGVVPEDAELRRLVASPETLLSKRSAPFSRPAPRPAPSLPGERMPAVLSASAHQRLLDCPYQFFAADGLGLRTLDDVRDDMEKSDYGRQVHRALQAFHGGAPGLPGPWTGGAITDANHQAAAELLNDIGRRTLGADVRLSARGWRARWRNLVDSYLDWLEKRSRDWTVAATELTLERTLNIDDRSVQIRGRIDRVDQSPAGLSIIDYKTGPSPKAPTIKTGEQSQLPFYALLHPGPVAEVMYTELGEDFIQTANSVRGEELSALVARLDERLRHVLEKIAHGAPLPAWGDAETCRLCRYEGVCRKEMWEEIKQ